MASTDPIKTRAWRKLRDQVVAEEPTCWLRFPGICTHVSTTADHIVPRAIRPDLAMVRSNLRGACRPCNQARGQTPADRLMTSEPAPEQPALDIFG